MLELAAVPSDVVGCYGKPSALDRLAGDATASIRVAPDELLLLEAREDLTSVEAELARLDSGGIAVDLSSAFAAWALRGDARSESFSRLSQIPLPAPPATVQGLVAHVPAKIVIRPDELLLLVPSVVSHHLHKRVLTACADLVDA